MEPKFGLRSRRNVAAKSNGKRTMFGMAGSHA